MDGKKKVFGSYMRVHKHVPEPRWVHQGGRLFRLDFSTFIFFLIYYFRHRKNLTKKSKKFNTNWDVLTIQLHYCTILLI